MFMVLVVLVVVLVVLVVLVVERLDPRLLLLLLRAPPVLLFSTSASSFSPILAVEACTSPLLGLSLSPAETECACPRE